MSDNYPKKMIKVPSYSLLREQDQGKMPVLDVRNLGIAPREILGDFDSLGCVPVGAEVFPVEKDDLMRYSFFACVGYMVNVVLLIALF